jgi:preprotein translocase subunit YajC
MYILGLVLAFIVFAFYIGTLRKKEGETVEVATTLKRGTESITTYAIIAGVIFLVLLIIVVAINENHKREYRNEMQQPIQQLPPPPPPLKNEVTPKKEYENPKRKVMPDGSIEESV